MFVGSAVAQFVNDDKLFNLFSNYGNVLRIKFLHSKPDHALVEMAEGIQAEMAVLYCKVLYLIVLRSKPEQSDIHTQRRSDSSVDRERPCCCMPRCSSAHRVRLSWWANSGDAFAVAEAWGWCTRGWPFSGTVSGYDPAWQQAGGESLQAHQHSL